MDELPDQCTATAKSTGEQCKRPPVPGGNVCHIHGGAAEQVQEKAQERLDRMADGVTADMQDAIDDLFGQLDEIENPEMRVEVMKELRKEWETILDRTGHEPGSKVEVDGDLGISSTFMDGDE